MIVKNPKMTNEDYCNALDRWAAMTPLQKRQYNKMKPQTLRVLAGLEIVSYGPRDKAQAAFNRRANRRGPRPAVVVEEKEEEGDEGPVPLPAAALVPAARRRRAPVEQGGGKNVHRQRPPQDAEEEQRQGTKRVRSEEEEAEAEAPPAKRPRGRPPKAKESPAASLLSLSFTMPPPPPIRRPSEDSPPPCRSRTPSPPQGLAPEPEGGMRRPGVLKQVTIHVPSATDTLHRCWSLATRQNHEELASNVCSLAKGMHLTPPQDNRPGCDCGLCE